MREKCTTCCEGRVETHEGFFVCVVCGSVIRPFLCPTESHNKCVLNRDSFVYRQPYCRQQRFLRLIKRICGRGPRIPDDLILFCEKHRPTCYSDVQYLVRIYRRETGLKPIGYAQIPSLYRIVTGESLPTLNPCEISFVVKTFNEIDFHARRDGHKRFAYNFLLRRIFELPHVQKHLGKQRALAIKDLVKPLACQTRCAKYYKNLNVILKKPLFK